MTCELKDEAGSPEVARMVLVVEDDDALRRIVVRHLERWGYLIREASDGGLAVEEIRAEGPAPDVMLLDIMLPILSGLDVARVVRVEKPELPIVAYSAAFNDEMQADLRALGVSHMLDKPFRAEELRTILSLALDQQAAS